MKLNIRNISKSYSNKLVLSSINLNVESGSVYCLLGKNGAGKSTLINIIANLLEPNEGSIYFDNLTYSKNELEVKKRIGLQSEFNQLIGELDGRDFLFWIGLLYKMDKKHLLLQIPRLLNYFFDPEENLDTICKNYSAGMKKKLAICAAVVNKPTLLILDEPFANLDPVAAEKLCIFLNAYKDKQRTIFISSHDLAYVDKISTHIGILSESKIVFDGTLDDFKENGEISIEYGFQKYIPKSSNNVEHLLSLII